MTDEKVKRMLQDEEYYLKEYLKHVQKVQKRMGMSIPEFHAKLEALVTDDYLAKAEKHMNKLEEWLKSGQKIYSRDGDELILKDGECFIQCFAPVPVRNELPVYWFLSNYGNLVSTSRKKVMWLPQKEGKDKRDSFKWSHPFIKRKTDPKQRAGKTIKVYALMALLFNPTAVFGRVIDDFEMFGSYCFGAGYGFWVNAHHKRRCNDYPDLINSPDNIQFLRGYVHDVLREGRVALPKIYADPQNPDKEKENALIAKLTMILDIEMPGFAVLVWPGLLLNKDGSFQSMKGEYSLNILSPEEVKMMMKDKGLLKEVKTND